MDKIAIVVQRYGKEVNGGAEVHARMLAEHLKERYEVDVLTSCALNFPVWDNHYPAGEEVMDGVRILRFMHEKEDAGTPRWLGRYLRGNWKYYNAKYTFGNFIPLSIRRIRYRRKKGHDRIFERWIENDGPICKEMLAYIEQEKAMYKAFIFLNYPFYPTYFGLQKVNGKSIFIPLAHNDPMLYLSGYSKMFARAGFIMYNTKSEKLLLETAHPITRKIMSDIAGVGIERAKPVENPEPPVAPPYFVYIGRIDIGKGCLELMDYFTRMNKGRCHKLKLVMIGKNHIDNPVECNDIIFAGFVNEAVKRSYLQHCEALIIPSRVESLSLVTLEAMAAGKPVLANGHCEVLRNHIEQSQAGFAYYDRADFVKKVDKILNLTKHDKQTIAQNGKAYVDEKYRWETIMEKFDAAIEYVGASRETSL